MNDGSIRTTSYSLQAIPKNISYIELELSNFNVREVLIDKKANGEYHIQLKSGNPNEFIMFLKREIGEECGLIDPDGILNLDYTIYVKMSTLLCGESIALFEELDKSIINYRKGATK
jgi:hypothetical protein